MSTFVRLLVLLHAIIPLGLAAQGNNDVLRALDAMDPYVSAVRVEVGQPGGAEPQSYALGVYSSAIADKKLAPSRYLVEYMHLDSDSTRGFVALLDDRMYRYDGRRFAEFSRADSTLTPSIARSGLFAGLLPRFLASSLREALGDGESNVEVRESGPDRLEVDVSRRRDSVEYSRERLTFALPSLSLLAYESLSGIGNPMTETSLSATYYPVDVKPVSVSRALLMERQGDAMRRFAGDNRCPESFLGHPFPPLTLPDSRGGRYTFMPGHETVLVLIDDRENPDALEDLTQDVRYALRSSLRGAEVELVYVILSRFADAIPASEAPRGNETTLFGGTALARELGARNFPLIIRIDEEGVVDSIAEGVNNDPASVVIEMIEP